MASSPLRRLGAQDLAVKAYLVQPGDTAGVLALRALPPLLAAAAAAACFPAYAWQAAAVGLCSLSPLPDAVSSHPSFQ